MDTTPISSTDTGPLHSKWHEACTVMPRQFFLALCKHVRQTGNEPEYMHSGPQSNSEPCVHRERPTGRVIIVIVAERRERRQEREERKRQEKRRGEKMRRREEERARKTEKAENPPCVDSKRLRVCVQEASVCTRKTPACSTHAGVFLVHTEAS